MRRPLVPVLLAMACFFVIGCKVTSADIDTWTGTQKGPGKIVAVLLADKYDDELRAYAGLALVRMEPRAPTSGERGIEGVAELHAALRQLPEQDRTRLVDQMAPELVRLMNGESAGAQASTSPTQVRAKDAAFLVIPYASAERQRELTDGVVDWFAANFSSRSVEGTYTAEQVVRQLGPPAASRLVSALSARIPQAPTLAKIAEIIASVGDAATKERAGARLVEIEREMESAEFVTYLQGRLRDQLREQMERGDRPRSEINEGRLAEAAGFNRDSFINLGALPAMKHLNGERAVQDRLLEVASAAGTDERMTERRTRALQALEGGVRADQVEALLNIALSAETPVRVRDYAFDRISDSRAQSALTRLWPVFDQRPTQDWRLRWRVGALILSLGGPEVVQTFFEHLTDQPYAREELYNYGERISQMRPPPSELMNAQLAAPKWYARAVALYYWEKRAVAEDLTRIAALETDSAATQGEHWNDQTTVGLVAQGVTRAVRARLAEAARGSNGAAGRGAGGAPSGAPSGGEAGRGGSGSGG